VRLVQTLLVRDEIDVIEAQIAYHLNAGVDFVIATDHDSHDGTTEVLERYARDGCLHLIREEGLFRDGEWRTRMARLAATEHGADWVINTDADEFWMPRTGTLKDVLEAIPPGCGMVWALTRHFVPRPDDGKSFADRMIVRLSLEAPVNDPTSPYRPHAKVAHRGDAHVVIRFGAHTADSRVLRPLRDWYPTDVLHFPFRSRRQYEHKGVRGATSGVERFQLGQYVRAAHASMEGRARSLFDSFVIDDDALERGRLAGHLVLDTRLRDTLDALGRTSSTRRELDPSGTLGTERVSAVAEGGVLREADLVRVQRRLDELSARVASQDPGVERQLDKTRAP
jgi:hypothetical protein